MSKNKITTLSYFTKRLKDSAFNVWKICDNYSISDSRKWTVMVDPGGASIFITCYENRPFKGEWIFEFNDGGQFIPKNFSLKTTSMEVVVSFLLEKGVPQMTRVNEIA